MKNNNPHFNKNYLGDAYWGLTKREFYQIIQSSLTLSGNPDNETDLGYEIRREGVKIARALLTLKAKRTMKYESPRNGFSNYRSDEFNYHHYTLYIQQYRFGTSMVGLKNL